MLTNRFKIQSIYIPFLKTHFRTRESHYQSLTCQMKRIFIKYCGKLYWLFKSENEKVIFPDICRDVEKIDDQNKTNSPRIYFFFIT